MSGILSLFVAVSLSFSLLAPDVQYKKRSKSSAKARAGNGDNRVLTPTQQRALWIVEQLFDKAKEFKDDQVKIRVQAKIADILWERNESIARRQFAEAFQSIDSITTSSKSESAQSQTAAASQQPQLRAEILNQVTRRDAGLAETLAKSVSDPAPARSSGTPVAQSQQATLNLQMALALADTNPEQAAKIASGTLNNGFNPMLMPVLQSIRRKNPSLANRLFSESLIVAAQDAARIVIYMRLLGSYVFPTLDSEGPSPTGPPQPTNEVNPGLIEEYLRFALNVIMRQANPLSASADGQYARQTIPFYYQTIFKLLPFFDEYLPSVAGSVRSQMNEVGRSIPVERLESLTNPSGPTRIEDLLSKAKSAQNSVAADRLYTEAASLTARRGDTEEAISIAENISSKETRSDVASIIRYQSALRAIGKTDFDTAYRQSKEITILPQCAMAFSQLARALRDKGDNVRALEVLNDAEHLVLKGENGTEKAYAMLLLTDAVVSLDISRGFEVLRSTVEAINHADFTPRDPSNRAIPRVPIGSQMLEFQNSLAVLAREDFDRALLLAQMIQAKDVSVIAQLDVCRGVLTKAENANSDTVKQEDNGHPTKSRDDKNAAEKLPGKKKGTE